MFQQSAANGHADEAVTAQHQGVLTFDIHAGNLPEGDRSKTRLVYIDREEK
jgi:Cu/Zn superoxide dismutase